MMDIKRQLFLSGALCFGVMTMTGHGGAQTKSDIQMSDFLLMKPDLKAQTKQATEFKSVPVDGPVNPDQYFLGPGDALQLNMWSSAPAEYPLTVTPEGYLLIPTVGAVQVKDLSLTAARAKIVPQVQKKYPSAEISLALTSPRKVTVHIFGQVMNEGMQEVYSVQRVDFLMEEANKLPSTQITRRWYDWDMQQLRRDASQRYITIQHRDGSVQRVDLVKYNLTGDGTFNPYLREGDRVFVPLRTAADNRIGVFGAVIRTGRIEYVSGDSLTDLLHISLGFTPQAVPEEAILARLTQDGGRLDTTRVDARAIQEGRAPDVALRPGDRLVIPLNREYREGDAVSVEGEFLRPGTYPITRNRTMLSDIVRMAGGFTKDAYVKGALLIRPRLSPLGPPDEIQQERLRSMRTAISAEDSSYYITETELRIKGGEIVSVDFAKLFTEGDSTQDVTLRNEDRINVPPARHTVYVFGQVITPGHVQLVEGESYRYYVEKAGGYTNDARTGDVKVIKGTNRTWLDPGETEVEDGDYIWVPKQVHYPFGYYLATVVQFATVLAALATVILVTKTL